MLKIDKRRISMIFLYILCAIFSYAAAREISLPPQIIGGGDASPNAWKWQASLRYNGGHFCGGSLIYKDWILTAAHCLYNFSTGEMFHPSEISVHLGAHHLNLYVTGEVTMGVSDMFHPRNYIFITSGGPYHHDIGLVKLTSPVNLTTNISTIRLASKDDELKHGDNVIITGWGLIEKFPWDGEYYINICNDTIKYDFGNTLRFVENCGYIAVNEKDNVVGLLPIFLQQTTVTVQGTCSAREKVICVGTSYKKSGACSGDSGGPMVKSVNGTWKQFGVASYVDTGTTCKPDNGSSKYTKVNEYIEWIHEITNRA